MFADAKVNTAAGNLNSSVVVVLSKVAVPGFVKTRLTGDLSVVQAAQVHAAMADCVLERLTNHLPGRHILALDDPDGANSPQGRISRPETGLSVPEGWELRDQGHGDLGRRIEHVWRSVSADRIAFFGTDSPDVPPAVLRSVWPALDRADAAVGPVDDGGYWTLVATGSQPTLVRGIDWGGPAVYNQTREAARAAGLCLVSLPPWHDVDQMADLAALRRRLESADEPALITLRERLRRTCKD